MDSRDRLRSIFKESDTWPSDSMSFAENKRDLEWHAKEFSERKSFTYTVIDDSRAECAGCLYIIPATKLDFNAEVYFWLSKSEYEKGSEPNFLLFTRDRLLSAWPFERVAFPGREFSWHEWGTFAPSGTKHRILEHAG